MYITNGGDFRKVKKGEERKAKKTSKIVKRKVEL